MDTHLVDMKNAWIERRLKLPLENGDIAERNCMVHHRNGVAFVAMLPFAPGMVPDATMYGVLIHVPSGARMFSIVGSLRDVVRVGTIIANMADWANIAEPNHMSDTSELSEALTYLLDNVTMAVAGSADDETLLEHLRASREPDKSDAHPN